LKIKNLLFVLLLFFIIKVNNSLNLFLEKNLKKILEM